MQLEEKSIAKSINPELLKDRKTIATTLLINYFGFLSLYSTRPKKDVRKYRDLEQDLNLNQISEENLDVSLAIKYALDSHLIPHSTANLLTKYLKQFKHGLIRSQYDIDADTVKELFIKCRFDSVNKVHPSLQSIVDEYISGEINLQYIARDLYRKSRLPGIKEICKEFREYFMYGGYMVIYNNFEIGEDYIEAGVPVKYIKTRTDMTVEHEPIIKKERVILKQDMDKKGTYGEKLEQLTFEDTLELSERMLAVLTFFNHNISNNSLIKKDFDNLFNKDSLDKLMFNHMRAPESLRSLGFNTEDVITALNSVNVKTTQADDVLETYVEKSLIELEYLLKNYRKILLEIGKMPNNEVSDLFLNNEIVNLYKQKSDITDFILNMVYSDGILLSKTELVDKNENNQVYFISEVNNPILYKMKQIIRSLIDNKEIEVDEYINLQHKLPITMQDLWLTEDYEMFKYNFYNKWYIDDVDEAQAAMAIFSKDLEVNKEFDNGFYNKNIYDHENGEDNFMCDVMYKKDVSENGAKHMQELYNENQILLENKYGKHSTVRLYRGIRGIDDPSLYIPGAVESWTNEIDVAITFAGREDNSYVFAIDCPLQYILTSYEIVNKVYEVTFMQEQEFFVLGGALQKLNIQVDLSRNAISSLLEHEKMQVIVIDSDSFSSEYKVGLGNDPDENIIKRNLRGI